MDNNGQKLQAELNTILESGNQAIFTWQRTVSETPDGQASYAVYSDCKLEKELPQKMFITHIMHMQKQQKNLVMWLEEK